VRPTIPVNVIAAAILACLPGHRLIDWSDRLPAGIYSAEFVVTVNPFYTRLMIYQPGRPETMQRCCGGRQVSVVRAVIQDGRFCLGQSQPQMTWSLHMAVRPDLQL
jgi:hypothetical protein